VSVNTVTPPPCFGSEGRTIVYRSDVEGMRSVIAFLFDAAATAIHELCNLTAADAAVLHAGVRQSPQRQEDRRQAQGLTAGSIDDYRRAKRGTSWRGL
jgi:hypothetical protein